MVSTRKGKRIANEHCESEKIPKIEERKPKMSKFSDSCEKKAISGRKNSTHPKFINKLYLPAVPSQDDVPRVSLSTLIEFAVQKTLREINILSELLPKKKHDNDSGRVRNLVQFADSLHAIFAKLLAVVKWIQNSGEFEKLSSINYYLGQQIASIVDTSDKLVSIDVRELHFARLPAFSVNTLAAGYLKEYEKLREGQIDSYEKLHHIIELQSALSTQPIPSRFDSIVFEKGVIVLGVSQEFKVTLTIAKKERIKNRTDWILLNADILVNNDELAEGKGLMHPMQKQFLYGFVKERVEIAEKPLIEVYSLLHYFCLRLQLDLIYTQVLKIAKVCQAYVQVENYSLAECRLVLGYWLKFSDQKKTTSEHQIIIYEDKEDCNSGLKTYHQSFDSSLPVLKGQDILSPSLLITSTILFRCNAKLVRIEEMLKKLIPQVVVNQTGHLLKYLSCQLNQAEPFHQNQVLSIFVRFYSGEVCCEIPALDSKNEEVVQLKNALESKEMSLEAVSFAINQIQNCLCRRL